MNGNEKAPKITSDDPNTQPLAAAAAEKSAKAKKKAEGEILSQAELTRQTEDQKIETPFLSGISDR